MKKCNLFSKATLSLIIVAMSLSLFAGCQSSKSTADTSKTTTENSSTSSTDSTDNQMKTQIQDSIKPLVTAGTITQTQSDKIAETLSTRPERNNHDAPKPQDNGQNGGQEKPKNDGQGGKGSPLSRLITDGTITQAQSETVMEKIETVLKKSNNKQNTKNSSTE